MRKIYLFLVVAIVTMASCNNILNKTVHGNGHIANEKRDVSNTDHIETYGDFDIQIIQGDVSGVIVEADENLLPYIVTEDKDGHLEIRPKEYYNLSSDNKIKVIVTTKKLQSVAVAGSGNVTGQGKFSGSDNLSVEIAGSGDITLDINTPEVKANIAGTGNITLSGETKDTKLEIAGVGSYKAEDLKSENVEIHIAGSGNARVFAENVLDIHIAGSGDVFYKGNASVKQEIAGSGNIKKID